MACSLVGTGPSDYCSDPQYVTCAVERDRISNNGFPCITAATCVTSNTITVTTAPGWVHSDYDCSDE